VKKKAGIPARHGALDARGTAPLGRRSLACVPSPDGSDSLLMIGGSRGDQALSSVERVTFIDCD